MYVVGWSGGGLSALALAVEHPEVVRGLVLEEPSLHMIRHLSRSMLAAVTSQFRAVGLVTSANISDAYRFSGLWSDWIGMLDGASQEHFVNYNTTTPGTGYRFRYGLTAELTVIGANPGRIPFRASISGTRA